MDPFLWKSREILAFLSMIATAIECILLLLSPLSQLNIGFFFFFFFFFAVVVVVVIWDCSNCEVFFMHSLFLYLLFSSSF